MAELVEMTAGDSAELWESLGFTVEGGRCRVGSVDIVFDPTVGKGIRRWALAGDQAKPPDVEGLPTTWRDEAVPVSATEHPNGITSIDHVVVLSPDVDRTQTAFENVGLSARRERLTDTYGAPMRQVFFRAGSVILELVGPQQASGDGGMRVFGLAFNSGDLDVTARYLGDRLHPGKAAVQPGRRIATLDKGAGSTIAIAVMTEQARNESGAHDD